MLSGKKFPQNVRAMRLVVEELLRGMMANEKIDSMEALAKEHPGTTMVRVCLTTLPLLRTS